ncbi:superoxide dismutase [Candidatus Woesearchaeota archaeon]|nr:superoxide dismutase [Candidatus Woesearchaeota archaeon]
MYEQTKLNYDYADLEPYVDKETMHVHYDKHHAAYTAKLNAAIEKYPALFEKTAEEILSNVSLIPEDIRSAVINNGGGYVNHNLFFSIMGKDKKMSVEFENVLTDAFGSVEKFKEEFENAALTQFGSGWAWLVITADSDQGTGKQLAIRKTSNQDTPLSNGEKPILCIDVWEHSYYLKYQNKRPDYVKAFWNVVNWEEVERLYKEA